MIIIRVITLRIVVRWTWVFMVGLLLIVVQGGTVDFVDGALKLVDRVAVRIVGVVLIVLNVNFVRFVGPAGAGGRLVGIHDLGSVIARVRWGIGIVGGRLTLGFVSLLMGLAVLRIESYEVFRPGG